jgi:hypothetical protein
MMARIRVALGLVAMLLAVCLSAAAEKIEPVKTLPDAPSAGAGLGAGLGYGGEIGSLKLGVEPFSAIALQVKVGLAGVGVDIATPVASKMNLRMGASFFSYNPNLAIDGETIDGAIHLESIHESFDFFPFGNSFRISPGVTFYNGNRIHATVSVAGGQMFTLNDVLYISGPSNPIGGTFDVNFGNQLAPSLTMGFGNMIPRKGGHWSIPFEIGAEYLGRPPLIALSLSGTACQGNTSPANCSTVASNPTTQQNVVAEQADLNGDIPRQLRFFPIVSIGVGYRFNLARHR